MRAGPVKTRHRLTTLYRRSCAKWWTFPGLSCATKSATVPFFSMTTTESLYAASTSTAQRSRSACSMPRRMKLGSLWPIWIQCMPTRTRSRLSCKHTILESSYDTFMLRELGTAKFPQHAKRCYLRSQVLCFGMGRCLPPLLLRRRMPSEAFTHPKRRVTPQSKALRAGLCQCGRIWS